MTPFKTILLKLANGANLLIQQMEKNKLNGIGRGEAFREGKPVCAVGHIVYLAGLYPKARKLFPDSTIGDNSSLLYSLNAKFSTSEQSRIDIILDDLTRVNDADKRSYKKVLKCVQEFEKALRDRAAEIP